MLEEDVELLLEEELVKLEEELVKLNVEELVSVVVCVLVEEYDVVIVLVDVCD